MTDVLAPGQTICQRRGRPGACRTAASRREGLDTTPRRDSVPGRHHGFLRWLQGAQQSEPGYFGRRTALHHRPQWRRQNHDDGCHHRQDAAQSGTAYFGQTIDLTRMTEYDIAHAGIGRKFQRPTVFEQHTVFENLELAMKMDKRVKPTLFSRLSSEQKGKIDDILQLIRLNGQEIRPAGLLSHGQKQWLEIGMLLMQEPQLLLAR